MSGMLRGHPGIRYTLMGLVVAGCIALGGLAWFVFAPGPTDFAGRDRVKLADYAAGDPTGVPASLANATLLERGQYLTRAADCEACHTAENGVAFAGGRAFVLPFGTIYSSNITPDEATGIGRYTDAEFLSAVHRGMGRGGTPLYPAMPYASYAGMTDADALAIKAYLFSLKPVSAPKPENALRFPFDQRWLMAAWSLLFDRDKRFEPHSGQSLAWNRGAYLVDVMGHCGECHTPRNLVQALDNRSKFRGTTQAGWMAYNISADRTAGIGAWSDAEVAQYLSSGHAAGHGTAAGPMGEAVDKSLNHLAPTDIAAMVAYLRSTPAIGSPELPAIREVAAANGPHDTPDSKSNALGEQVFEGACASCHDWTGESPLTPFATLVGARAVNDPAATNVAQIVLFGGERKTIDTTATMPAFGPAYSDAEIAAVASYVTQRFGAQAAAVAAADIAKARSNL
jgi:mono/diheme cytochrome c family protein